MSEGITVSGTGRASAPPDLVCLSIAAEAKARDVQRALDGARAGLTSMREVLLRSGVAERDLRTTETSVWSEQAPAIQHTARLGLDVLVRDVGAAGELMSAALAAAGDTARMNGINFTHSDPDALASIARERAWDDACAKAEQFAGLAGRPLGEVVSVTETEPSGPRPLGRFATFAAESVPVDAGEQTVTASVTVTWAWAG